LLITNHYDPLIVKIRQTHHTSHEVAADQAKKLIDQDKERIDAL
jgi:hypothetical protein